MAGSTRWEVRRWTPVATVGSRAPRVRIPPPHRAAHLVAVVVPVHHAPILVTATPGTAFRPTPTAIPGGAALQAIVNGIGGWALIIALAGLVIGAAMWALGAHSQNYQQSFVGRKAVLVSGLAALVIGAAPVIIDFFFHTGLHIPLPQ